MSDEVIKCADCRIDFTFTESEASFYASKGLTKPRRCKPCRQKRKASTAPQAKVETVQWVNTNETAGRDRKKSRRRDRNTDDYGF